MKTNELIQNIFKFNPPERILDIGANRGQSVLMFKDMFPSFHTSIFAYEPNKVLSDAIEAMKLENCYVFTRAVISDVKKYHTMYGTAYDCAENEVILHKNKANSTISTISPEFMTAVSKNHYFMRYCYDETVKVAYSLTSELVKVGFDLIKVDTEGCDADIVSGYLLSLRRESPLVRTPRLIICEYTSEIKGQFIELFHQIKQYAPKAKFYFAPASCGYLTASMSTDSVVEFFDRTPEDGYWGDIYIEF